MEFPDVLELDKYWATYPPMHLAMRGIVAPKSSTGNIPPTLTDTEERLMQSGNVIRFNKLPPSIQKWLKETRKQKRG